MSISKIDLQDVSNHYIEPKDQLLSDRKIEKKTASINVDQTRTGNTEILFKAQEALQRATVPNLKQLDREQTLKTKIDAAKTAHDKFLLVKELFKLKVEALKNSGVSIEEFSTEHRKTWWYLFAKTSYKDPLKNEIIKTYEQLRVLVQELCKEGSLDSPALQFYELEKETGFSDLGAFLLMKEVEHTFNLLKYAYQQKNFALMQQLYWSHFVPNFKKILGYLESDKKDPESNQMVIEVAADILDLCKNGFATANPNEHPFVPFLKIILKYVSLEDAELFFNEQFKGLNPLDKIVRWIDLHCQAAEILAPTNLDRANHHLKAALIETESKLWAFRFSFNKTAIQQKKQEALARIARAKETVNVYA
jgi:hypothetical protein